MLNDLSLSYAQSTIYISSVLYAISSVVRTRVQNNVLMYLLENTRCTHWTRFFFWRNRELKVLNNYYTGLGCFKIKNVLSYSDFLYWFQLFILHYLFTHYTLNLTIPQTIQKIYNKKSYASHNNIYSILVILYSTNDNNESKCNIRVRQYDRTNCTRFPHPLLCPPSFLLQKP